MKLLLWQIFLQEMEQQGSVADSSIYNKCREQQVMPVNISEQVLYPQPQGCQNPFFLWNIQEAAWLGAGPASLVGVWVNQRPIQLCWAPAGSARGAHLCLAAVRGHQPRHRHLVGRQGARLVRADHIAATWDGRVWVRAGEITQPRDWEEGEQVLLMVVFKLYQWKEESWRNGWVSSS